MTSFIVASNDRKKREEFVLDFCQKKEIDKFDITIVKKEEDSKNLNSIGINDIKDIQKKIFLTPIVSKTKAVILEDAHLLTTEAQNALLKVLEEPPDHTIIMLCANSRDALLPTIQSRCKIIELGVEPKTFTDSEIKEYSEFIENLDKLSIGEKLKKAEEVGKDKDEAILWVEKLIVVLRNVLLENPNLTLTSYIKSFQELHKTLKTTNASPRLAIETTLLSL